MNYSFDLEDAKKYGVDRAIILSNLRFWLFKNQANEKHLHEFTDKDENHPCNGKSFYWTYNSSEAFHKLFPFWSANKIQKDLKWLENEGVILTSSFNKSGYDRTKWYSMPCFSSFSETAECNQPNGGMEKAKPLNEFSQMAEPIPDIKHRYKTDNKKLYKKEFDFSSWPNKPTPQVLADWFTHRDSKKAKVTQTVIDRMGKEILKAHLAGHSVDDCLSESCTRGWTGFKAEWLTNTTNVTGRPDPLLKAMGKI